MASKYIVYRDWSRGDIGRNAPGPNTVGMYRGVNCWEYPNGGIGPRPPWQNIRVTGLPNTVISSLSFLQQDTGRYLVYAAGTTNLVIQVFSTVPPPAIATAPTTSTNGASFRGVMSGGIAYFCSSAGVGFSINLVSKALTNIATMPAGNYINVLGAQTLISGNTAVVYSSDLGNPAVWNGVTSGNVQVGDVFALIRGLHVQRNSLVTPKFNGDVWQVAGLVGFNEVVRKMDQTSLASPPRQAEGSVVCESGVWWVSGRSIVHYTGAQALIETLPDIVSTEDYPVNFYDNNAGHVCPVLEDNEFLVIGSIDSVGAVTHKKVYMSSRSSGGAWNRHDVPIFYALGTVITSRDSTQFVVPAPSYSQGIVFMGVGGSGAFPSPTKFFQLNARQEFPHLTTDPIENELMLPKSTTLFDGDSDLPVRASLTPSEYWSPEGETVEARSVTVDYSYDPQFMPTEMFNTFTIAVEALRMGDSAASVKSSPITFVPDTSKAVLEGGLSRGQVTFNFGDQGVSEGFRVLITAWSGLLIHRVAVKVVTSESRN